MASSSLVLSERQRANAEAAVPSAAAPRALQSTDNRPGPAHTSAMGSRRAHRFDWADRERASTHGVAAAPSRDQSAGRAILAGLDPGRLPTSARAASLAEIGASAGNRAVADLVSEVRADFPLDPPEGVRQIRAVAGGGSTLGHTRLSLDTTAPLFRLPAPSAADGGFTVKPGRTRAPELQFEVRYPTPGRHLLFEGRTAEGGVANTYLEVSSDWSTRVANGEDEHVQDQTIAWRDTWQRVAELTNQMADAQPVRGATPEAAIQASWARFVDQLPPLLRPAGREPSNDAQLARWGWEPAASAFRRLIGESKRARDDSQWHTPSGELDHMEGHHEVRTVEPGSSRLPGPLPAEVMKAAWDRLEAEVSGGGSGGRRRG
jgi:hypothetical protein